MLNILKNINFKILLRISILLGIICLVSYFFAFAKADGGEGIIFSTMTFVAIIFGLPFYWLCTEVKFLQDPAFYIVAILFDILIYSFIIERVFNYYFTWQLNKARRSNLKKS